MGNGDSFVGDSSEGIISFVLFFAFLHVKLGMGWMILSVCKLQISLGKWSPVRYTITMYTSNLPMIAKICSVLQPHLIRPFSGTSTAYLKIKKPCHRGFIPSVTGGLFLRSPEVYSFGHRRFISSVTGGNVYSFCRPSSDMPELSILKLAGNT